MSNPNRNKHEELLNRNHQQHQSPPSAARSSPTGGRSARPRFEEQQPIMRSVAISPAVHHQRTLHFEPALRRVDPGGSSATHLRPLRGISQPDLALKSTVPPKPTKPQLRVIRSKSDSSLTRKWHVEESDLSERPGDFPTLRTSRTVRSAPAHVISNRLSDCLQSRSIKTRFSKSEGNMAKCRNTSFCKFAIRLYAAGGGAAAGEEGAGGILVEVQRLCGDYVSFMKDCRALLNAAEGKATEECSDSSHDDQPLYLRLPVSEMAFVKTASLPPVTREEEAESLNVTAELLSSRQSDSNMLGMESLAIQTDSSKTLKSTAILASRRILCPTDGGNASFNMHNYVMSLLIYGNEDASSEDEPEDTTTTITALEDHSSKLRNLAMSSLHNALSLFASESLLLPAISDNEEWYASVLIPKLLHDLSTAENNPHDACYASRCLSTLAESSGEFASRMNEGGAVDILKTAEEVGSREFALLARDAGSCQKMLSCCV